MAKAKNPNREKALKLFLEHKGDITNRAIAKKLDVSEKTISVWKYRDKWKEKLGGEIRSTPKKKRSTSKKISLREQQRTKIIDALNAANSYSPALDILIDVYLDAFEEYEQAKVNGLETESLRKEIAKLLGSLGLNINNKSIQRQHNKKEEKEDKPKKQPVNKLVQFRKRMTK